MEITESQDKNKPRNIPKHLFIIAQKKEDQLGVS